MLSSAGENPEKLTEINGDIPDEGGVWLNENNGTENTHRYRRCCPDGKPRLVSVKNTSLNTQAKTFCTVALAHDTHLPVTDPELLTLLARADFHHMKALPLILAQKYNWGIVSKGILGTTASPAGTQTDFRGGCGKEILARCAEAG